jgi:hypothetical protein
LKSLNNNSFANFGIFLRLNIRTSIVGKAECIGRLILDVYATCTSFLDEHLKRVSGFSSGKVMDAYTNNAVFVRSALIKLGAGIAQSV